MGDRRIWLLLASAAVIGICVAVWTRPHKVSFRDRVAYIDSDLRNYLRFAATWRDHLRPSHAPASLGNIENVTSLFENECSKSSLNDTRKEDSKEDRGSWSCKNLRTSGRKPFLQRTLDIHWFLSGDVRSVDSIQIRYLLYGPAARPLQCDHLVDEMLAYVKALTTAAPSVGQLVESVRDRWTGDVRTKENADVHPIDSVKLPLGTFEIHHYQGVGAPPFDYECGIELGGHS